MKNTSPSLVKKNKTSLTKLANDFKSIAKDLTEYVKIRTGKNISTASFQKPITQKVAEKLKKETTKPSLSKDKKEKSGFMKKFIEWLIAIPVLIAAVNINIFLSLQDVLTDFASKLSEGIGDIFNDLKEGLAALPDKFMESIKNLGDKLSTLWSDLTSGSWVEDLTSKISETYTKVKENIGRMYDNSIAWLVENFTAFKEWITSKFSKSKPVKIDVKTKPKEPTKQEIKDSLPTETKGVDKDGFEYTERKAAKKVVKTPEQIEYEKKRDAELEERSKKSREKFKKIKERKEQQEAEKAKAEEPTPTPAKKEEPVAPTKVDSEKQQHLDLFEKYIEQVKQKVEQEDYVGAFEANRYTMLAMKRLTKWADENGDEKDKKIAKYLLDEASVRHINLKKKALTLQGTSAAEIERIETTRIGKPPKTEEKAEVGKPTKVVSGMEDTKAMIIQHEGKRNKPYKDSLGLWTVGVGHLIGDGKTLPPEWNKTFSDEEVMNLFEEDFAHHKKIAEETPGYQAANEGGKAAFIDLSFNMGKWWPKWPTTKKLLENEQFEDAASAMKDSKWYTQVGNRAVTITSLVAQAGDGKGEQLASDSNEVAITKRSMSKPQTPVVVNTPKTVNNTVINNDFTPNTQDKLTTNSLVGRMT